MSPADPLLMKMSYLSLSALTLALAIAATPSGWADSPLQNSSPGAQGTEGTNPTHQDQDVTGPNGQQATNTNPADVPPPAHKKKKHKKTTLSSTTTPTTM